MMPEWELFNRRTVGRTREPMITIQKDGNMTMNAAAFNLLRGDSTVEEIPVELLYDKVQRVIGIRPSDGGPLSYVIRKQANSASYIMAGRAFTQFYGIDTSVARRYKGQMFGNILGIRLSDPFVEVFRAPRK